MPPLAQRIEYRNGTALVAEVACSADGITGAAYSGASQVGFFQLGVDGSWTVSTGGGVISMNATGLLDITGFAQFAGAVRMQLPNTDPLDEGRLWNDSGTVKVSAG